MIVAMSYTSVAFVAAVGGALGAGGGLLVAWDHFRSGPAERQHQTELSRRQLLHDQMRSAYSEYLERTYFVLSLAAKLEPRPRAEANDVPPLLAEFVNERGDDWSRTAAFASVVASEEVAEGMSRVIRVFGEFNKALGEVERTPDDRRSTVELNAKRDELEAAVDELEKRMRADVRR